MPFRFRFRLIPFLAAAVAVALGCVLGNWQMTRAADKLAIEAKLTARRSAPVLVVDAASTSPVDVEYRKIAVRGTFIRDWPLYLDNRPYHGVPGFYVLMPLQIEGSATRILVQRGWLARDVSDRARIAAIPTPAGPVEISGIARSETGHVLQLGRAEPLRPGAIVQNVAVAEVAASSGQAFLPFVLEQTSDVGDKLVRDWPQPSSGVDKHYGYAFQWYALAATAFIFFVVTGFRRERK